MEYKRSLYRHPNGRGVNSAQGARATWGLTDAGAEAQPKDNQTRTSSALIFAGEEEQQGNNEEKTDHLQEEQEAQEK